MKETSLLRHMYRLKVVARLDYQKAVRKFKDP